MILDFIKHFVAVVALFVLFFPAGAYFLFSQGFLGNDTTHFLYYVIEFSKRLPIPPAGWKMTWFEGTQQFLDNPWLNFYLIQPLVGLLGPVVATKTYLVAFLFVFILFSYLVFWELSKNRLLSLALAVALSQSYASYIQLFSAGVGLSSISQVAFPASLYFLIRFVKEKKNIWLGLGMMALSFGFYSQALVAIFFAFIPLCIFLLFSSTEAYPFWSKRKLTTLFVFVLGVLFLSAPSLMAYLADFLTGGSYKTTIFVPLGTTHQVGIKDFFETTNLVFYLSLIVSIFVGIFLSLKKKLGFIFPIFLILVYLVLFQLSYELGVNPLVGMLFPHRSFWLLPVVIGALVSALLFVEGKYYLFKNILISILALLIMVISLNFDFQTPDPNIKKLYSIGPGVLRTVESLTRTYPVGNLFMKFTPESMLSILSYVPISFFDIQDINHRIYAFDVAFRVNWNMFYRVPITHGYHHYSNSRSADWIAWLYAVFSRENYEEGGIPEDVAERQSLFLTDWYGIRYIIATPSQEFDIAPNFYRENPYISSRTSDKAPFAIKISDEYTSEIAKPVNVPVVGFVGDDQNYDYLMRNLGILNLNSNYLVPIRLGEYLEDLTPAKLKYVDLIIIYNYKKKKDSQGYQKAWDRLKGYIESGGKIFIESGAETPEKWGEKVPEVYPISSLTSGSLGTNWNVETEYLGDFDFTQLSPLTYEQGHWALTYVPSESYLKPGSKVLLRVSGKPVLVEGNFGSGKVIWSGLNSFYRPMYHKDNALNEASLLRRIIGELIPLERTKVAFDFERPKSEKVNLRFSNARGALLKENNYGGWVAYAKVGGKKIKLPILAAGPDFMYAPLPQDFIGKPALVEFVYQGTWYDWLYFLLAIGTFVLLLEAVILKFKIVNLIKFPLKTIMQNITKGIKGSWNEES